MLSLLFCSLTVWGLKTHSIALPVVFFLSVSRDSAEMVIEHATQCRGLYMMRYVYLISNSLFGFRAKTLMLNRQIAIAFELSWLHLPNAVYFDVMWNRGFTMSWSFRAFTFDSCI